MLGIKLVVVAAVLVGAVVAGTPDDSMCHTAPAVTTTVTVTVKDCGQPTMPAVSPSESGVHTAPPPAEASSVPAVTVHSSATPPPAVPSGPASGSSYSASPTPPASSGGPTRTEPSSPEPSSVKPTAPSSSSGSGPSSSGKPQQPPSNGASHPGTALNMGVVVAVGVVINAVMAALV